MAKALSKGGLQIALQEYWNAPRYEETLGLLVSILFNEGRFGEIEAGIRWLIGWGKAKHERDPRTLRSIGRSPLRTALHVLGRSAVPLNSSQLSNAKAEIDVEVRTSMGRRYAVAGDRSTPAEVLERLAADEDVRWGVAKNVNMPVEVLARLAADEDRGLRWVVAGNVNTPVEVLARLAADEDGGVREEGAENVNTLLEDL